MNDKTFPIVPDGFFFIIPLAVLGILCVFLEVRWAGVIFLALALFVMWFFRNPHRVTPEDERAIVSPADGRIIKIEEMEETEMLNERVRKVSIFMSVLNVHVNRAPCSGTIEEISYSKGKFFPANLDKASKLNERNSLLIKMADGGQILTTQIAGIVARRIVCWTSKGMQIQKGERFGLIKFGSRLEVFMPLSTTISVKNGDRVRAGETKIGHLT